MASDRYRSNKSIGNKINNLDSKVASGEKNTQNPHMGVGAVEADHLAEQSVTESAIASRSITEEKVARGAIGTEHLGVVNEIVSDSGINLKTGPSTEDYLSLEGAGYVPPTEGSGQLYTLAYDEFSNVIATNIVPGVVANSLSDLTDVADTLTLTDGYVITYDVTTQQWRSEAPAFGSGMAAMPAGSIMAWPTNTAPEGWLIADGSAVSRTTYADLFASLVPSLGSFTVTIGASATFTKTAHGLTIGDAVYLTTSGALPTGLASNTLYYVQSVGSSSTFTLSATRTVGTNGYSVGAAITTSGTQSGTHTIRTCRYGLGDGSTTFNLPDLRGRAIVGRDSTQTEFDSLGESGGAKTHTLQAAEIPGHSHVVNISDPGHNHTQSAHSHNFTYAGGEYGTFPYTGSPNTAYGLAFSVGSPVYGAIGISSVTPAIQSKVTGITATTNNNTGGDGAHNNLQPYRVLNYIIKYTIYDGLRGPQGDTGATGATGATGSTGAAATIAVGTVTTGAPGTSATVVNSGTSGAATFNFEIPRGATGATGATGPQGLKGDKGDTGATGAGGALGYYGAYADYTTQTVVSTVTAYTVNLNTTIESNGITLVSGSQIRFDFGGTFNINWAGQFSNTSVVDQDVRVWLRKNGTDVPASNSIVAIPAAHDGIDGHVIATNSIIATVVANDFYEIMWSAASTSVSLKYFSGGSLPTTPATPSMVVGIQQVMNTQIGPTGATGPQGDPGIYIVSPTAPTSPSEGDAWFNSTTSRMYIRYDGYWVETASNEAGPTGPTGATGATGATGPQGPQGIQGIAGAGVAAGGASGTVLTKISGGDYDTTWTALTLDTLNNVTSTRIITAPNYDIQVATLASSSISLDFSSGTGLATRAVNENVSFTGANYRAGAIKTVRLVNGSTLRNITFPAGWVFLGSKPTTIAANKTGVLTVTSFDVDEANCVAAWSVQI